MLVDIFTAHDGVPATEAPNESSAWNAGASAFVRVRDPNGTIAASCALWRSSLPTLSGKRLGYIGAFKASTSAAAAAALEAACDWLAKEGCQLAVGPIDGSTWHRYRLVTESSPEPPFPMEPTNPSGWSTFWSQAGFTPLATYHSAVNEQLQHDDQQLVDASARAKAAGLSLRPLALDRFEEELRAIFDLSFDAFADNFLYYPIGFDEFASMYAGMHKALDPRLVLLCDAPDRPGTLAGYIMAFPDMLECQRIGTSKTLILKTLAVHPRFRSVGLGTWLVAQAQTNAHAMGLSRAIFALMHDTNHSARISRHYSHVIRRYTLFARELHA